MINVVIVEDDPMVMEVNKGFLEEIASFSLIGSAVKGKDAIELIENLRPDLVLLDVYLPDITGIEVLYNLREKQLPVDVIMITAAKDTNTVQKIFRYGAIDYLVKPFHFERFQQALTNYAKMWKKFSHYQEVTQADIDMWSTQKEIEKDILPKGLSEVTLKQVMLAVSEQIEPVTAEQLAVNLGMARVTVRRYLDYLEKSKQINMQVEYGKVGRPSNYYFA
ncbi:response regulator [Oceanobacillus alkalisoli]|uniref:response regulator n=1 Tax=Oceanobacillus alkalisoli TaxID=2925113 RepID=UPI001EE4878E|nr:response regulator [Oceanobacillus alkalisoli]MCG5102176.1 response regulator [Oceanobacillus alkalisoli]